MSVSASASSSLPRPGLSFFLSLSLSLLLDAGTHASTLLSGPGTRVILARDVDR